jgi:hypothetical protein
VVQLLEAALFSVPPVAGQAIRDIDDDDDDRF